MRVLFPFIALLCFLFTSLLRRSTSVHEQKLEEFWAREQEANKTRKKNIDNLDYITIPFEKLPLIDDPSEKIASYQKQILLLKDERILNLEGISNTDLMLTYGAANLTALSRYDENYTLMVTTFSKWAEALLEEQRPDEAQVLLETAVEMGCVTTGIFTTLAQIYADKGLDRKSYLTERLKASSSPLKQSIQNKINKLL
ncbi:MAG: hypothetical protein NC086_04385 [Alistipes sp.]|nr:hypothetical protein [Alistipes sp.]